MEKRNSISVEQAAKLMGVTPQFVRIGLQRGTLQFGWAVKMSERRYRYYISRPKFEEATGIVVGDCQW